MAGKVKGNAVQLQAGVLTNRGEVQAGQTLNWQGSRLANSGTLQGDKQLVLKGMRCRTKALWREATA